MSEATAVSVRGIVFAHGDMAQGLVDAVTRISGVEDALIAVTNAGKGPDRMKADLAEAMAEGPVVVFTDLTSGSCAMTALGSCRDNPDCRVICGVNLPVLLDFVFHRDTPLDELVQRVVERGRESIRAFP